MHRSAACVDELAVLDLGVQDASPELARLSFAARLSAARVPVDVAGPDRPLALVWSLRGAPHVHRRADLPRLAGALHPLSEADAAGRLNETGPSVARAGIAALQQYAIAVREMRSAVRAPMAKGAASTAVTTRIPAVMRRDCRACKTRHISDSAMRTASLAAGLELQPGTAPPVLQRWRGVRVPSLSATDVPALQEMIRAYLWLLGPATQGDVASYLDSRRADIAAVWPDGLVEVSVDGRAAWLPEECVEAIADAPAPEIVRLLGAFDPYLQARDRELIVADSAERKALWPVLGRPGVLFVDGEVAGTWRPRTSGAKLILTVTAFAPLPPSAWKQVEVEAEHVAAVRGLAQVDVARVQ